MDKTAESMSTVFGCRIEPTTIAAFKKSCADRGVKPTQEIRQFIRSQVPQK
ncbi:hypothetical protein H6F59_07745 [Nodosilinea sp. FACHB-141]|uniref:Uncharacterized protein n=1 Tax=Leptolyngbya subtilissima DQ-A4 TaxID=2933933 RepID=A0ABV0KEG6_9CYAN|nr:hypothetical protein [Nodosilinea sp. FACHB-141]